MNPMDRALMSQLPTVMVPRYEDLEPCGMCSTRILMAATGMYLETLQPWGRLVLLLWRSPRPLPYGKVEEVDTFHDALESAEHIMTDVAMPEAARYADTGREWVGWIVWDNVEKRLFWCGLDFEPSCAEVGFEKPRLGEGLYLVIDIHSHGDMPAGFSLTDDNDDAGGVKIAVVLGSYRRDAGFTDVRIRYCVHGFFFSPTIAGTEHEAEEECCDDSATVWYSHRV